MRKQRDTSDDSLFKSLNSNYLKRIPDPDPDDEPDDPEPSGGDPNDPGLPPPGSGNK